MTTPTDAGGTDSVTAIRMVAVESALWAAAEIARTPPGKVTVKTHHADLVTALDVIIERNVRQRVATAFPEHRFIGEEQGATGPESFQYTWFCDPIDGTTNYANGIPWCSFALCCHDRRGPLLGVVADPYRLEVFIGCRGEGATVITLDDDFRPTVGGGPLTAHQGAAIAGTVLTTEWLAHQPWPGMSGAVQRLASAGCTVRIMGSSALSVVQAAAGRAAGCILGNNDPIDDSAALLIAAEAGAVVCDKTGRRTAQPVPGGVLVAGPLVADAVFAAWQGR